MVVWRKVGVLIVGAAWGCSSGEKQQECGAACAQSDAGDSGGDVAAETPVEMDAGPETAPCTPKSMDDLPDDEFVDANCDGIDGDKTKAIFVAPSGADGAPGTMDAPLKKLAEAVDRAAMDGKSVYVCNGTYQENVVLTAGVSIYGGFDCAAGWKRTLERATIAPTSGIPFRIKSVTAATTVDRVRFKAADATGAGASSIAVLVTESSSIEFKNDVFDAGAGADGETPTAPAASAPATAGKDGVSLPATTCARVSTSRPPACSQGGAGGQQPPFTFPPVCENWPGAGGNGGIWRSTPPTAGGNGQPTGTGALGGLGSSTATGNPGKSGAIGAAGASSTIGFGTFSIDGYSPTNVGTSGSVGTSGGGGGGGAGGSYGPSGDFPDYFYNGGGGGEGGFGGCGGAAGRGGGGGGGSFALLLWNSPVTIVKSTFNTANGGQGGGAGPGGDGQAGGAPGKGGVGTDPTVSSATGKEGGAGGKGGKGGPGGAGGGGPSIAIVAKGGEPAKTAVVFNIVGGGGKGGVGLAGGADGADGETAELKKLD